MLGKKRIVPLLLVITILFAGCSLQKSVYGEAAETTAPQSPPVEKNVVSMDMAPMPMPMPMQPSDAKDTIIPPEFRGEGFSPNVEEKLIYKANLSIETMAFDTATAAVSALIKEMGAFIETSSKTGGTGQDNMGNLIQEGNRNAFYMIRVPKAQFEAFLEKGQNIGVVVESGTETENITTQFHDVQGRLISYKIQQERLLAILEKAEKLEDVLAVENQLTQVRFEIENLTTQLNGYQTAVDYSTVSIHLREVIKYTPPEQENFVSRLARSVGGSLEGYGYWLQSLAINLIYALPFIFTLAVLCWLFRKPIKKLFHKKENKKHHPETLDS